MRLPLLLLLALPLPAVAQYTTGFSNINPSGNNSMRQFSNGVNQANAIFQRQVAENRMARTYGRPQPLTAAQLQERAAQEQQLREKKVALHRAAEQHALDGLADYAHYQDSLRRAHPAATPQLAAAQEQADAQELARVKVKNYRDIFLPGQVLYAEQARLLSPSGVLAWETVNQALLDDAWWQKQEPAQVPGQLTAYRATLVALTTDLLGFDPATAPKPVRALSLDALEAMRANGPFDPQVADQYMQQAARAEKMATSTRLVGAVNEFNRLVSETTANAQPNPQQLRNAVKSALRTVNKEMERYELEMAESEMLKHAQATVDKYATAYLPAKK
ncbi:hypothetical protein Q5H92_09910 [Hymenobacter sp. M29]|uniref:Uncharacterized protein n=1 Tax=Hymenobacter mellowenesis TaxID=3063995 RepID=A0ABT9AA05_9BACT|nr:hypothetical protein [Hymenobacter sp. M29]MDO7846671.1 hypothetical protein [Hymenobacter sp. M29]